MAKAVSVSWVCMDMALFLFWSPTALCCDALGIRVVVRNSQHLRGDFSHMASLHSSHSAEKAAEPASASSYHSRNKGVFHLENESMASQQNFWEGREASPLSHMHLRD